MTGNAFRYFISAVAFRVSGQPDQQRGKIKQWIRSHKCATSST